MHIELHLPQPPESPPPLRDYDPELDDVRSILSDVCDWAEPYGIFVVGGFGQDPWPLDVRTDLLVVLEQLPEALLALSSGAAFEIDFYEQGVERRISFSPNEGGYAAACLSYGNWRPDPSVEKIDRAALDRMLTAVRDEFLRFIRCSYPGLELHPWLVSLHVASAAVGTRPPEPPR